LSDHLQQATAEREVIVNTGKGGTGIGSFLRETVDNIKGVDAERAKQERLVELESRIDEVYIRRACLYIWNGWLVLDANCVW